MKNTLNQKLSGAIVAAIILTLVLGCQFASKSDTTVNNSIVQNTDSVPVSNQTVATKNPKNFWGGWVVQTNSKYPKTQFVLDPKRRVLINYDYGNDSPPDNQLENAKFDYVDRETINITLSNGKSATAKLNSEGNIMTIDNFKGDSLTLKLITNRMKYAVCLAKPKSCDETYPFDN
jgi:hypothetical protein